MTTDTVLPVAVLDLQWPPATLLQCPVLNRRAPSQVNKNLYKEKYRPQYHFTPVINWMNDPNGLVYHDGQYHLYYQYNPLDQVWQNMSWGHAVSDDLVNWKHRPLAISHSESVMIFSGSAVLDFQNTSGFGEPGKPAMVCAYTGHHRSTQLQDQRIAYSVDKGLTWTQYEHNPVIDLQELHHRDPKIFWYEPDKEWKMVVSLCYHRKVIFYTSPDLKNWLQTGEFGNAGADTYSWECPDLFPLEVDGDACTVKWVLVVSIESGGANGLSGIQYFIGNFDGKEFKSDLPATEVRYVDYGREFYAAQTFSNMPDGRRVVIGWMSNVGIKGLFPTNPWRGVQSLPRVLSLRKSPLDGSLHLYQKPIRELESLRKRTWTFRDLTLKELRLGLQKEAIRGQKLEIKFTVVPGNNTEEFGIKVLMSDTEETTIGYNPSLRELYVDLTRSGESGFDPTYPGVRRAPLDLHNGLISLSVFIDCSCVEVFANDGQVAVSSCVFPSDHSDQLELFGSDQLFFESTEIHSMRSIWHYEE